jgi:hypothetical protein
MSDEATAKPNRRRTQEARKHAVVAGAQPPAGIHKADKKVAARKLANRIKKARKS